MKLNELTIETLATIRTMTRTEAMEWAATQDNTTVKIIVWESLNARQ